MPVLSRGSGHLRAPVIVLGAVFLLLGACAAGQTVAARAHLLRGAQETAAAGAAMRDPLRLSRPAERREVRAQVEAAREQFGQARADLSPWRPLLSHLGWLPKVGPELAAAGTVADISYRTADAAINVLDGAGPVLGAVQKRRAGGPMLPRLSGALAVSQSAFLRAQADLIQATLDLSNVPSSLGVARLDAMLTRLRHAIPRLRGATTWLALAPDLLGAHRPATYLFVWQNPAELRATGGFMGASDLVTIDRGRISHRFYGHALPHDITWPPMPLPEEMYTPETTWLFEDSNWSPDFPLSARFERWFYGEDTGRWAMGVVNFLDTATPDLLGATGPVYLPRYRVTVDARTVTPLAQRFVNIVNARYNGVDNSPAGDRIRKQFFVSVMQALLDRVQHVSLDRLPALGRAVARMIQRRELLAYDRREAVEGAIRMAGADGGMVSGPGDYLFVVDDNRSYNKLNPYVREGATLAVTVTRSLALDETLTIRYHVDPSPANLEGGGPNWGLWGTKHDYQDFLRIYVPLGATLVSVSGMDPWSPQIAYGRTQFAGRLLVREGQSRTVAVRYRVPANVFLGQGRPRSGSGPWTYRLRVQQQPGANLQALRVLIRAGAGVRVEGGSRPYETTLPLQVGARLRIAVTGQVNPKPVVLPRLPLEPDPYIPFQYLQDRRHPL